MKLRGIAGYGPAFVLAVGLLAFWELYVRSGRISPTILPTPTGIVQALIDNWDVISVHTLQTLLETVLGMPAATLLPLLLAALLDLSSCTPPSIYPLLATSQTTPIIP